MIESAWLPLLIFIARIGDVSMGTMRMISVMRGHRSRAVVLGFFEIIIWLFAASGVLTHLDQWLNVLAYAGGYAAGNAVGMWLEGRLALGMNSITFISRGVAHAVAERLRLAEFCVTCYTGMGAWGSVAVCHAIVPRKLTRAAIRMAREIDSDVVVTVEDVRETTALRPTTGMVGGGKTPLPLRSAITSRISAALRRLVPPPAIEAEPGPPGPPSPSGEVRAA